MLSGRVQSFRDAFRGVAFVAATQPNAWIHAAVSVAVVCLGFALDVSAADWRWLVAAIGLVWVAEAMNTALERLADAVSTEHHPLIGQAKDAGAASVLLAAITAAAIGILVFAPRVIERLSP